MTSGGRRDLHAASCRHSRSSCALRIAARPRGIVAAWMRVGKKLCAGNGPTDAGLPPAAAPAGPAPLRQPAPPGGPKPVKGGGGLALRLFATRVRWARMASASSSLQHLAERCHAVLGKRAADHDGLEQLGALQHRRIAQVREAAHSASAFMADRAVLRVELLALRKLRIGPEIGWRIEHRAAPAVRPEAARPCRPASKPAVARFPLTPKPPPPTAETTAMYCVPPIS